MHGKYTLTETAEKIGVTSAWINRVQRETKIGGEIGKKGHKVSFTDDMVEVLRRVKVLRLLGFSFPDIKGLYELEENILGTEQAIGREYQLSTISGYTIPLIIHPKEVVAMGPLFLKDVDKKTQQLLYKDKNIERYASYINELHSTAKEVIKRKDGFMSNVDDVTGMFKKITGKYPDISE